MAHARSISNTLYYVLGGVCVHITGVGLFMDTIVHSQELTYTVKKFVLFNAFFSTHGFTSRSGKSHYNIYALK